MEIPAVNKKVKFAEEVPPEHQYVALRIGDNAGHDAIFHTHGVRAPSSANDDNE